MGKPMTLPLQIAGQYVAGDAGAQPEASTRLLQNHLSRPNRFPSRAPFAYDGLMAVNGLANLDDLTDEVSRLIAIDDTQQVFLKSATSGSEAWGSANDTSIIGTRLIASSRYRGLSFLAFADAAGVPNGLASFDGTTVSTTPLATPYSYSISPRALTVFGERTFLSSPRVTFSNNLTSLALTKPYDWSTWTLTNCASQIDVEGATKTCRVTPTATTGAVAYAEPSEFNYAGRNKVVWRQDLRGTSATYEMPFTMEVVAVLPWSNGVAYALHDVVVDSNENWQRCSAAGTSGGSTPAWATTVGSSTVDGGVTWVNSGSAIMGQLQSVLPITDPNGRWTTYTVTATVPATNGAFIAIHYRFKFGNNITPTITLAPIDVSYRDGLADGDKAKTNRGTQVTNGDFAYPFYNIESGPTTTIDLDEELWSEIGLPGVVSAANNYRLTAAGATGFATNACVIGNRKLTFKRSVFWQFQLTDDPDIPIRVERLNTVVGCVGPLALDTWNDTAYFIGEYEIFAYSVGGSPTPLCGDGMREEIMGRGISWVESQSTYNRPILRIDHSKLIMWVYTQAGKLYAYDLTTRSWSTHTLDFAAEIDCMEWNRNTGNMYVSFGGHGLTRMDYDSIAYDVIDDTATDHPIDATVIFRPIELFSPPRYDYALQQIRVMHGATEDQTGQTVTASYSFDQGKSFTRSTTVALAAADLSANGEFAPLRLPCRQGRATITAKLSHVGKTGEIHNSDGTVRSAWTLSPRAYADVIVRREERVQSNPSQGASNL